MYSSAICSIASEKSSSFSLFSEILIVSFTSGTTFSGTTSSGTLSSEITSFVLSISGIGDNFLLSIISTVSILVTESSEGFPLITTDLSGIKDNFLIFSSSSVNLSSITSGDLSMERWQIRRHAISICICHWLSLVSCSLRSVSILIIFINLVRVIFFA
ncbi:MAG: hypothetical protein BWY64_03936 [bacterium ADurb.Bin363]|nr:MAG: hypothetical protein BWY64_03936 [bacterium ADurb.Bin363]